MKKAKRTLAFLLLAMTMTIVALDLISPLIVRRQLDTAASAAARAAAGAYFVSGSENDASLAARKETDDRRLALIRFQVRTGGDIRVTVGDTAQSFVLGRIPPLHRYFEVEASATAKARVGPPPTSTTKAG